MPKKRKSEAGAVVIFFQTQPLDVAKSILDICQDTVAARMPPKVEKGAVKGLRKSKLTEQSSLLPDKVS